MNVLEARWHCTEQSCDYDRAITILIDSTKSPEKAWEEAQMMHGKDKVTLDHDKLTEHTVRIWRRTLLNGKGTIHAN